MAQYRAELEQALAAYWGQRSAQLSVSRIAEAVGAGTAGAVRGAQHFNGIAALLATFFVDAGYPTDAIRISRSQRLELPGYFRPTKQWDLVITHRGVLVAAFEMKALGGPSFGNNFNNRVEEALGTAIDVQRAHLANLYPGERPWLGYFFIMEDAPGSRREVRVADGAFPTDPIWQGASYQKRFETFCERILDEGFYDAVCYLTSSVEQPGPGEPSERLDWAHFAAAITSRIAYLSELGYP